VTNAADTGLASETTYYYRVRAHNIIGDSDYSGIAPATTLPPPPDLTPPAAVIDLALLTVTSNSITLRWTAPGDDGSEGTAAGYDVRVSTAPIDETTWPPATPAPNPPVPGAAGTVETFTIEGLAAGTAYWFALKTVDETNNLSALSNVPTGATLLPGLPAPPTALIATAVTSNRIALTWVDHADNEAFFSIERFSNGVNFVTIGSAGVNATNYLDSGLVPETTYFYRVKAGNAVGDSAPSNIAQVTTPPVVPPDTTPPAPVADLRTGAVTTNSVILVWTAPGDDGNSGTARRYDLRYRTSSITEANWATSTSFANVPVPLPAGSTQTVTVAGLRDDSTYYFALKTADETNNLSPLSNVRSVTTPAILDTIPPGATNLVSLIPSNSVWKYLDNGTNQGAAWTALGFDDTLWASGPTQIGYGNGSRDITVASFGPDPNHKPITTYFRRGFTVADPSRFESLRASVVRDDGAVVYLNGSEVYRDNMPTGPINYLTVAASSVSGTNKTGFHPSPPLAATLLHPGNNVVAVEVHQRSASSSQLAFNLELSAGLARPVIHIALNSSGQVSLDWETYPGKHYRVLRAAAPAASSWTSLGADITAAGPTASATDSVIAGAGRYYRVVLLD
jgi:chitodextrinase